MHRRRVRLGELAYHSETLVAKGRGRRCDQRGGIVSVLARGDLPDMRSRVKTPGEQPDPQGKG